MKNNTLLLFITIIAAALIGGCSSDDFRDNPVSDQSSGISLYHTGVPGTPQLLVSGLEGSSGSTIGPGGALYVTEGAAGRISRVDPGTGEVTTFASGLPPSVIGVGGVMDVTFIGSTAYALVTLVDDPNLFPTGNVNGIYRIDGPDSYTIIADLGSFNVAHPPSGFDFFVVTGVLYSIEKYQDGFLVTDGHLNRVLYVTLNGDITIYKSFNDIVPTGLEVRGNTVYMAEAGPVPHLPENGKVISFNSDSSPVTDVASGARLLVDVEYGRGQTLFALSQGIFGGGNPGDPALPNTGSLVVVNPDGTFTEVVNELNQPTSLDFIGNTAYIVTLSGEVWSIDNVAGPPFGH